jgi:DNA-binding MarR family transcriptional regulator
MPGKARTSNAAGRRAAAPGFPPRLSSGYLVRDAHRAFQKVLERRIAQFGVSRGQWYFLRVLWQEDGLTQRELSDRVGTMEPTTVIALQSMERAALISRVRRSDDRRKTRVFLTPAGRRLSRELLPVARAITRAAERGIPARDLAVFRRTVAHLTLNLDRLKD